MSIIKATLGRLHTREERLLELFLDQQVDRSLYETKRNALRQEMRLLEKKLQQSSQRISPDEGAIRQFLDNLTFKAQWVHDEKRDWLARFVRAIRLSNDGVESLVVPLPATGNSLAKFVLIRRFVWGDLLGYDPFDLSERMAAKGKFLSSQAAERLDLKIDALRRLIRIGVLPEPKGRYGDKRWWSEEEIELSKTALRSHRGEDLPSAMGLASKRTIQPF
jgi:hypothetical protein